MLLRRRILTWGVAATWFVFVGLAQMAGAQIINEEHKLVASDGNSLDLFGSSVSIHDGIAAIGAPWKNGVGNRSGAAYIFDIVTGTEIARLVPDDGAAEDRFGNMVAIGASPAGTFAAVSSPWDDDHGDASGSVYLFEASTGLQVGKLTASDASSTDNFGLSVAVDGRYVAVGAPGNSILGFIGVGSAYVFDATTRTQVSVFIADDWNALDQYGDSIDIHGSVVAVGAPTNDDSGPQSGSAYLVDAATGVQIHKLLPNDGSTNDRFGSSVGIDGTYVVVGAPYDDDNAIDSGSAYVFDASTGSQIAKLLPDDPSADAHFGARVAISDGRVVVGHFGQQKKAYLFDAASGEQVATLEPTTEPFSFGDRVAISGNRVVVGESSDAENGPSAGAAYTFDLDGEEDGLSLEVDNLVAGSTAVVTVSGGTPGAHGVTVYGTRSGKTVVNGTGGYCASFAIRAVNQGKVVGGVNQVFDANGNMSFSLAIPPHVAGVNILFQSAERGTCPDERMSNVIKATVE